MTDSKKKNVSASKSLKSILDWIYSLPLNSRQQAVLLVHGHHCDYWNGHNSRPGTTTIRQRARLKTDRRVQQIHRELQADPACPDCRFTGTIRGSLPGAVRCPCFLLERGPLVETAPARGNLPATYRLNLDLRPWSPVQLPLADPRPKIIRSVADDSPTAQESSTSSTDPEISAPGSSGDTPKFSVIEGEISHRDTPKFRGGSVRNSRSRNKEDLSDRNYNLKDDQNTPAARASQKENYSREDLALWLSIKGALRGRLTAEEWDLWVRPARLLWSIPGKYGAHLVVAVPPAGKVVDAMVAGKLLAHEVACQFNRRLLWTRYPDDWQIEQVKKRFGRDLTRKQKAGA